MSLPNQFPPGSYPPPNSQPGAGAPQPPAPGQPYAPGPAQGQPGYAPAPGFPPPLPQPGYAAQPSMPYVPQPARVAAPTPVSVARPVPVPAPAGGPAKVGAPAAARPIPVSVAKKSAVAVNDQAGDEEDEAPELDKVTRSAPPWLISLVFHLVLLIVMAFIYISSGMQKPHIAIEVKYAEELGDQLDALNLAPIDSTAIENKEEILTPDNLPRVDDPLAAMPDLAVEPTGTAVTSNVSAPQIGLALTGRSEGSKQSLLAKYGGNATTEATVEAGLKWLKKNQQADGGWSMVGPFSNPGDRENRVSATAMALLAFQGAGNTHKTGRYKDEVRKGWSVLIKQQNAEGDFFSDRANPHHHFYTHAQSTIALCELYGMTKDEQYKKPAQLALNYIIKSQDPQLGGWRYEPRVDSDVSVTGWCVMALQSGLMAGLDVPSPMFEKVGKFLDKCTPDGMGYGYQVGRNPTDTMTAEALLCRQYMGWKRDDPRMVKAINEVILKSPIDYSSQNVYYWYYATQVTHHVGLKQWEAWNKNLRQLVPEHQTKEGAEAGSWSPKEDAWGQLGGRLYTTCLSIYMLEVYYRHLPIYKF